VKELLDSLVDLLHYLVTVYLFVAVWRLQSRMDAVAERKKSVSTLSERILDPRFSREAIAAEVAAELSALRERCEELEGALEHIRAISDGPAWGAANRALSARAAAVGETMEPKP